ncbi:MAG: hypothetical protein IJD67_00565 [Clostridia bacterium]|nr:hypothetical protein [Clostridia bacterium]
MKTQSIHSIRAVKNLNNDTILIYRATYLSERDFEIAIERYMGDNMTEASSAQLCADASSIENLLKNMCLGSLEPCHLKDVLEDMCN